MVGWKWRKLYLNNNKKEKEKKKQEEQTNKQKKNPLKTSLSGQDVVMGSGFNPHTHLHIETIEK